MRNNSNDIEKLTKEIDIYLHNVNEKFFEIPSNIHEIPAKELFILCKYFSVTLIASIFGGSTNSLQQKMGIYKKKFIDEDEDDEEFDGIGSWRGINEIVDTIIKDLKNLSNSTGKEKIDAIKILLKERDKTNKEATELMQAYEKQLIVLVEHILENFLPGFKLIIKNELKELKELSVEKIKNHRHNYTYKGSKISIHDSFLHHWNSIIDDYIRVFSLKKFEKYFAETLLKNKSARDAFGLAKDLLEQYEPYSKNRVATYVDRSVKTIKAMQVKGRKKKK